MSIYWHKFIKKVLSYMPSQEKDGEQMSREDKKIIEQLACILVSGEYITSEEQIRILDLLKEKK